MVLIWDRVIVIEAHGSSLYRHQHFSIIYDKFPAGQKLRGFWPFNYFICPKRIGVCVDLDNLAGGRSGYLMGLISLLFARFDSLARYQI